ncbi:MAG: DUF3592 domain-containing protein, partial [Chloroflexi bacterium]|nr:DUF3592 domain-containing protein [Chloroflexota bacterium]
MTFILNPTHEGAQRGEPVDYEFNQALIENPLVGLVGGALLMLVAVLMAITLLRYLILDGQLRRTGDVVQADVVETSAFVDPQDPDDIKDAVYTLTYAFSVGGETYQRTQDLLPSEYTQLRDAESVPVRYWPDDPALSRIAIASSERFNTGGVIALGLGAAIFGGTG